jgi:hypothetical protein
MTLHRGWQPVAFGCLAVLFVGCDDGGDVTGGGGAAGSGGAGGTAAAPAQIPGLWEGAANGFSVCFYVSEDGQQLMPSAECDVTPESVAGPFSFDLAVELVGTDENGQRCSFDLGFGGDVTIDRETNAFRVVAFRPPGEDVSLSFSGELTGNTASGVARSESEGSSCQVGWAAKPVARCDDAAIQTCLALQDCCESILVNPVFFQSCNSVVLQCNEARCRELLRGYPQCASQ